MLNKIIKKYKSMNVTVRASFWFTIASLFQKGLAFLVTPFYTRYLSTESYGTYSVYLSWMAVLTVFATLSLPAGVLNNSILNEERFETNDNQVLSNFQTIELFSVPIIMLIVIGIKVIFPNSISLPFNAIILMSISILFSTPISLWSIKERYRFKYTAVTIVTMITSLFTVVINVLFVCFCKDESLALIYGSTLALVASNIIILFLNLFKGKQFFNFNLWKYAICFNLPLIPHYLANTVLVGADRIMIDAFCSASDAALYSVAYSMGNIIMIFVNAINASFSPYAYQKLKEGKTEGISSFANTVLCILIIISGLVMLAGPEVIFILGGEKYIEAKWVIPPVSGAIVFFFLYPMFACIEFFFEKRIMTMIASVSASLLNVLLNFFFIPRYGYVSAAFTTLFCYMMLSLFHYVCYCKICKSKQLIKIYDNKKILLFSGINIMMIAVSYLLYLNDYIRYCAIILFVIGVVLFRNKILFLIKNLLFKKQ